MPQMSKGGKYIFGWSVIHKNGEMAFPTSAIQHGTQFLPKTVSKC